MNEIYVSTDTLCIHSASSDEPYGDWSAGYVFSIKGVSLDKPRTAYEKFSTCFDVKQGDFVYVLSMTYSEGDSFGSSTGNGEVLWVFKDIQVAKTAKKALENHEESFSVIFFNELGEKTTMSNPGAGYFESVEDIQLQTFIVGG